MLYFFGIDYAMPLKNKITYLKSYSFNLHMLMQIFEKKMKNKYLIFFKRLIIDVMLNKRIRILIFISSSKKSINKVKIIMTAKEYPHPKHLFRGKEKNVKKIWNRDLGGFVRVLHLPAVVLLEV